MRNDFVNKRSKIFTRTLFLSEDEYQISINTNTRH